MKWIFTFLNSPDLWIGWIVSVAIASGIHGIAQFFSVSLLLPPEKQPKEKPEFPQPFRFFDPLSLPLFLFTGWGWTKPYPLPEERFEKPFLYTIVFYIAGSIGNIALAGIISTLYTTILPSSVFRMAIVVNIYCGVANLLLPFPPFSLGRGLFAGRFSFTDRRVEIAVMTIITVYTVWVFKTGDNFGFKFIQDIGDFLISLLI